MQAISLDNPINFDTDLSTMSLYDKVSGAHKGSSLETLLTRSLPYFLGAVILLLLLGGVKVYSSLYRDHAADLLQKGEALEGEGRLSLYREVVKKYPRSEAAMMARLYLGFQALQAGQLDQAHLDQVSLDQAVEWYDPVSRTHADPLFRITALHNLALAWDKKGDTAKAITYLKEASADPENAMKDYSQILLAHLYTKTGQNDQAREILKILSESGVAVKEEAAERLKWQK